MEKVEGGREGEFHTKFPRKRLERNGGEGIKDVKII